MDLWGHKATDKWARAEAELARTLIQLIKTQRDLELANEKIELQREDIKNLLVKIQTRPTASTKPLYLNEEQEDALWSFQHGLAGKEEVEDILKELDFDNTQVVFETPPKL